MSDRYEEEQIGKVWTVIKAALQNPSSRGDVRIETSGHEPHASITIPAYVLEKFLTRPKKA